MTTHDDTRGKSEVHVLDGLHRRAALEAEVRETIIPEYDATADVGIRTRIYHAAIERIDRDGEETIEVPKPNELRAAAAVARCLMPIKLRGAEIRAIRKIVGLTLGEFAKSLDDRAAAETVSRWESEAQPMGGYAEKILRLFVCEQLKDRAPGIDYAAKMIADLKVLDPWRLDPDYNVPAIELRLLNLKEQSGGIIEAWNMKKAA
jgi:DNA-binding transcriptional regulator YiaG